jgi:hypothetical protein
LTRITVNSLQPCRLCGQQASLSRSHILPEFLYKPTYDGAHRALELRREEQAGRFIQKGHRERLLCERCEGQLSRYEKYFKEVWFDRKALPSRLEPGIHVHTVDGLDYRLFRLFHLSLLWRASISEQDFFEHVALGAHEDAIRRLLLGDDPAQPELYHWMAAAIMHEEGAWDHMIMQPVVRRIDDRTTYVFLFAGCLWFYFVSNTPVRRFLDLAFRENGRQVLLVRHARDIGVLRTFFEDFFKGKDWSV